MEVPISISYRTSGIKVNEIAGPVGLGWTLHAGGSVAKQTRGKKDEELTPLSTDTPTYTPNTLSLASYISKEKDSYHDKFYYSYPGGAGSFILGPNYHTELYRGEVGKKNKTTVSDDIIEFHGDSENKYIKNFVITDPNGRKYEFGALDRTLLYNFTVFKRPDGSIASGLVGTEKDIRSSITGWNLSSVTSSDGKDRIDFSYTDLGKVTRESIQTRKIYTRDLNSSNPQRFYDSDITPFVNSAMCHDNVAVKTISFNGNTVNFSYTDSPVPDTTDPLVSDKAVYDPNPVRRLSEIRVLNFNNELIRRIVFKNREGEPSIKRYKLNTVEFYDGEGHLYDRYDFAYNDSVRRGDLVAILTSQPSAYAQDHFGYYNGQDNNTDLNFFSLYDDEEDRSYKRAYNFEYAKYQTLRRLDRLGGASTNFSYEPNRHVHPTLGNIDIGIRIKDISVSNSECTVKTTSYRYEQSGTTIDFTKLDLSAFLQRKQYKLQKENSVTEECLECSHSSLLPGVTMENAVVFYGKVTEETTDAVTGKIIRTDYVYDTSDWTHTYVAQKYVKPASSAADAWKYILIEDYINSNPARPATGRNRYIGEIKGYFKEKNIPFGNITKLTKYESLDDGTFKPVEEQVYMYKKYNQREVYNGWYVKNMVTWPSTEVPTAVDSSTRKWMYVNLFTHAVTYADNYMRNIQDCYFFPLHEDVSITKRVITIVKSYYGDNSKEESTLYSYNIFATPKYEWPCEESYNRTPDPQGTLTTCQLRKTTQTIDGDSYEHRYLYCDDYSTPAISVLGDNNHIYKCVGEEVKRNGTRIRSRYTNYKAVRFSNAAGKVYWTYLPERTIEFLKGEITAETNIENYDSHLNPVCISSTGQPRTCYVWGYKWTYPVAQIKGASYEEVKAALGGNKFIENIGDATSPSAFMLKLNSLRNLLPNALVTTYTYKPLVGVTSVADPAGRMITYHYDGAGRLNAIKDEAGNLLETYEYGTKN